MDFLAALWLPILLAAAGVFVASALGWMLVNHHGRDQQKLGEERESKLIDALHALHITPGVYGFPDLRKCRSKKDQKRMWDTMFAKPVGILRVWRHPSMGASMATSFLIYLVVSTLIAYLGWAALPHAGAPFARVFQVLGTAGVLSYSFAFLPNDVWFQNSRRAMVMNVLDGIVFGLVTGAIFAWKWPA